MFDLKKRFYRNLLVPLKKAHRVKVEQHIIYQKL